MNDAVGLQLVDSQERLIVERTPTPMLEPEAGRYGESLGAGETRRMLTDLSPLIPGTLAPGRYEPRLQYVTPRRAYGPKSISVVFRTPTSSEAAQLTLLEPERKRAANWASWTVMRPRTPVDQDPIDPANPLALHLLLRIPAFNGGSMGSRNSVGGRSRVSRPAAQQPVAGARSQPRRARSSPLFLG